MKHLALLSLLTLSTPVWAATSAPSDFWQTDFSKGRIPAGMTTEAKGQKEIVTGNYKHGGTLTGWDVQTVGSEYCAVCPTSTGDGTPVESILGLPAMTVPADKPIISWSARSMLPQRPEAYVIRARVAGDEDWTDVATVEAENSVWTTRSADLSAFVGKETEIQLVCVSPDCYMLAVGFMRIGAVSTEATFDNVSRRFAENPSARGAQFYVEGTLTNIGIPASANCTLAVKSGAQTLAELAISAESLPALGEGMDVKFPVAIDDNTTTSYTVELKIEDAGASKNLTLAQSDVFSAPFARQLLVDEGTGVWCTNCPEGILLLDQLQRDYPGQCNVLATHVNDVIANAAYWPNLGFYAVPYFMLNREKDTKYSNLSKFANYYKAPAVVEVTPKEFWVTKDESGLSATLAVTFAENTDNTSGKYGLCYVITSPFHSETGGSWRQQNNCAASKFEQYYFFPSYIAPYLSYYEHVTTTAQNAFTPVEGLISTTFDAYDPLTVTTELEIPEIADDIFDCTLVAFVIDTETGVVLNSASIPFGEPDPSGSVSSAHIATSPMLSIVDGGVKVQCADGGYSISVFDATGRMLMSTDSTADAGVHSLPAKGLQIVSVVTRDGHRASIKVFNN